MTMPTIGVVPLWDEKKNSMWMLPGYHEGILGAGGIPVTLPLTSSEPVLRQLAEALDGFLFTGGGDIHPSYYGEEMLPECNPPCPQRDEMEQLLFAEVMHLGKPIFAICRGIQIVNVFLGGTLIQDIPSQTGSEVAHSQPPPYSRPSHDITVEPGTPLYELFGRDTLPVNSDHHQCVKDLAPSLAIMARCKDDGLTEAVYMPDKPFVWGVQWHPECALDDPASHALFKKFVDACMKK